MSEHRDPQYAADLIRARNYLVEKHGEDHVRDLEAWSDRIEAFIPGLRERMGYPDPTPLTPEERERAEREAEDANARYSCTTSNCAGHYDRWKEDRDYYHNLPDDELARALSDGWEGGYYEHY